MPRITAEEVRVVAHLARLSLTDEEVRLFTQQLDTILDYVQQLQRLKTESVSPTTHVLPLANVLRPDQITPSLDPETVAALAPQRKGRFIQVPKIIETEPG
ncbi:MAG: Asp-tRNA(Asn)/Glu-tRNA(Gln) amidotransferase subunit GatC [Candidatus Omnitrophica bacterium]|nr:Asp-tRNA(Asn)/Glu-tRNA(Gln) amidotransferase subunit GatC [Candidatus Omnitrophota bacterium]